MSISRSILLRSFPGLNRLCPQCSHFHIETVKQCEECESEIDNPQVAGSSTFSSFAFLDFRTFDASVVLSSVQTFTGHEVMNFGIPAIFNQGAVASCSSWSFSVLFSFFFFFSVFSFPSFRVSCFKVSDLCFLVQELLDIKSLSTVPRIWTQCLSIPSWHVLFLFAHLHLHWLFPFSFLLAGTRRNQNMFSLQIARRMLWRNRSSENCEC